SGGGLDIFNLGYEFDVISHVGDDVGSGAFHARSASSHEVAATKSHQPQSVSFAHIVSEIVDLAFGAIRHVLVEVENGHVIGVVHHAGSEVHPLGGLKV